MMLLPSELRTLVFLAGLTAVCAQADDTLIAPVNTTAPSAAESAATIAPLSTSSGDNNDLVPSPVDSDSETPPKPDSTDDTNPCYLPNPPDWCEGDEVEPPPFWQPEVSASAWDEWGEWNNGGFGGGGGQGFAPTSRTVRSTEQPPAVITTRTPTVIEIRTSVEPSATDPADGGDYTRIPAPAPTTDSHTEQQESPAQPTAGQQAPHTERPGGGSVSHGSSPKPTFGRTTAGHDVPGQDTPGQDTPGQTAEHTPEQMAPGFSSAPAFAKTAASTGSSLLDSIISQLVNAEPGAQPAAVPTGLASGETIDYKPQTNSRTQTIRVEGQGTAGPEVAVAATTSPGVSEPASTHSSIEVGNTITLGSATLTLTPGLSTIIGIGLDTTLVAIQTDSASRTVITVSSSGTAITATMTNVPATVTLPRTGFEADIISGADQSVSTSRPDVAVSTTESRGMANERSVSVGGCAGFVLGLLGFALAS